MLNCKRSFLIWNTKQKNKNSQYPLGPQMTAPTHNPPAGYGHSRDLSRASSSQPSAPVKGFRLQLPTALEALASPSRCVPQGLLGVVVLSSPRKKKKRGLRFLHPLGSSSLCRFPSRAAGTTALGYEGRLQHRGLLRPRATGVGEWRGGPLGPYSQHILQGAGADEDGDRMQVGRLQPPHSIG